MGNKPSRDSSPPNLKMTNSSSFGRPSDEEILQYEQKIKETEVDTNPIVTGPLPIASLLIEYENGAIGFSQKIVVNTIHWNAYHINLSL